MAGKAKPIIQAVIQPGSRSIAPWLVADAVRLNRSRVNRPLSSWT